MGPGAFAMRKATAVTLPALTFPAAPASSPGCPARRDEGAALGATRRCAPAPARAGDRPRRLAAARRRRPPPVPTAPPWKPRGRARRQTADRRPRLARIRALLRRGHLWRGATIHERR